MAIAAVEKRGAILHVQLADRLDSLQAPQLEKELEPYINDDIQLIVMDFSKVAYVSSAGFRVLLWLEQNLEKHGGEVQVVHADENILKVFELVGFMDVVHVITD